MSTGKPANKGSSVIGALMDFLILVLLVGGAGFGGYFWGTTQRLAPVKDVAPGTPGALPSGAVSTETSAASPAAPPTNTKSNSATPGSSSATAVSSTPASPAQSTASATPSGPAANSPSETAGKVEAPAKKAERRKFWISSSGTNYIGYSITATVNGTPVDNFFGPGKTIDITSNVKPGENTILFEAKSLGNKYNKHKGDASSELVLHLVAGPYVQENFKSADVLVTYKRNASETEDFSDTKHFVKDE